MVAKPPLVPLAKVIEFTVTVFPEPMFLLSKLELPVTFNVSEPIRPFKVKVVFAKVVES